MIQSLLALLAFGALAGGSPPQVGQVAPPLGAVRWLQVEAAADGGDSIAPDLAALRGRVVVVHTFARACETCLRAGVPTVVALQEADREDGLLVLSLTAPGTDESPERTLERGRALGIEHPLGCADEQGGASPYFDLGAAPSPNFVFVVGREGGLRWKGDPTSERHDFLAAVSAALNAPAAAPLPEDLDPRLAEAVRWYVEGRFDDAGRRARRWVELLAPAADAGSRAAAEDARRLAAAVEATERDRRERLEAARASGDAEGLLRAATALAEGFPREVEKRARVVRERAAADPELGPGIAAWGAWLALERDRPPLFPVVHGKQEQLYAVRLARWLDRGRTGPGTARARGWLARWGADARGGPRRPTKPCPQTSSSR